jgi:hypothetical protein
MRRDDASDGQLRNIRARLKKSIIYDRHVNTSYTTHFLVLSWILLSRQFIRINFVLINTLTSIHSNQSCHDWYIHFQSFSFSQIQISSSKHVLARRTLFSHLTIQQRITATRTQLGWAKYISYTFDPYIDITSPLFNSSARPRNENRPWEHPFHAARITVLITAAMTGFFRRLARRDGVTCWRACLSPWHVTHRSDIFIPYIIYGIFVPNHPSIFLLFGYCVSSCCTATKKKKMANGNRE